MADAGLVGDVTIWHNAMYQIITELCPPSCTVHTEVSLSQQPGRVDMVLMRRTSAPWRHGDARILRGLWPLLGRVSVVEFKSPRRGFRTFDLMRLIRQSIEYHEQCTSLTRDELNPVLLVPGMNEPLAREIEWLGCRLEPLGGGYARLTGPFPYTGYVGFLNEVAEVEHDEYLKLFTTLAGPRHPAALRWMQRWKTGRKQIMERIEEMEGYDEFVAEFMAAFTPRERLAGLAPEQILAEVPPEQRLAGLAPEEILAEMPAEQRLAGLAPEQILAGLAPEQILAGLAPEQILAEMPAEQLEALYALLARRYQR